MTKYVKLIRGWSEEEVTLLAEKWVYEAELYYDSVYVIDSIGQDEDKTYRTWYAYLVKVN